MKIAYLRTYLKELSVIECLEKDYLQMLNHIVGGFIETLPIYLCVRNCPEELKNVLIILDEEGKIKEKPINIVLETDYLAGDIAFVTIDGEEMRGLSEEQINILQELIYMIK